MIRNKEDKDVTKQPTVPHLPRGVKQGGLTGQTNGWPWLKLRHFVHW